MAPRSKREKQEPQDLLGVEKYYSIYYRWCSNLPSSKARLYFFSGVVISLAVIAATIFIPLIPDFALPFLTWPIGVFAFLAGLCIAIRYGETHEEHITVKERFSFKQRIRILSIVSVVVIVLLLYCSQWIPSALGGTILIAYILTVVNTVRRTQGEIEIANLGLIDERDLTEDDMDDPRNLYFEETDEVEEDEVTTDRRDIA